ncbi:hypothetical protein HZA39_03340 [Candidatus Peregrinibacteria bacterium]|nr:hypothetical protein [Candidatus Peregrinibacteria bacterium]
MLNQGLEQTSGGNGQKITNPEEFICEITKVCDSTRGAEILKSDLKQIWVAAYCNGNDVRVALKEALESVLDEKRREKIKETLSSIMDPETDALLGYYYIKNPEKTVDDVAQNFRVAAMAALELLPRIELAEINVDDCSDYSGEVQG